MKLREFAQLARRKRQARPDAAHAVRNHACEECGGYSLPASPESGPPCQRYITELEAGILAGNDAYRAEYAAIRERWNGERVFTTVRL